MLTKREISKEDFVHFFQDGEGLSRYTPLQRGKGFASIFKNIFRFIRPLLISKGREALSRAGTFAKEVAEGTDIKEAGMKQLKGFKQDLLGQTGSGRRKRRSKSDIFHGALHKRGHFTRRRGRVKFI